MKLCVIDIESTGLYPEAGHEPWEIGLIVRGQNDDGSNRDSEFLWRIKPDLTKADPQSLRIGRFYERTAHQSSGPGADICNLAEQDSPTLWSRPEIVAGVLAVLLDDAIVIGANPGFDKDFIRPFLRKHGQAYTAHYRPICVTTLTAGFLYGRLTAAQLHNGGEVAVDCFPDELRLPWSSNAISAEVGVNADDYDRHSALGDCRWALAQFDAVTGGGDRG